VAAVVVALVVVAPVVDPVVVVVPPWHAASVNTISTAVVKARILDSFWFMCFPPLLFLLRRWVT
jgi:hypothetical protein